MRNRFLLGLLAAGVSVPLLYCGTHAGPLDRGNTGPRVNPLTSKMFTVPGAIGQACDMALSTIQASQLNPSLKEIRQRDKRYEGQEGRIVAQTPTAGGMAMYGSTVSITCYRGEPDEDKGHSGHGADTDWGSGNYGSGSSGWGGAQEDSGHSGHGADTGWGSTQEDSGWGSSGGTSGGTGQNGQEEYPSWGGQGWPPPPSTDGQTESTSTSRGGEPPDEAAPAEDGAVDEGQSGKDAPLPVFRGSGSGKGEDAGKGEDTGKDEGSGQVELKKNADRLLSPRPVVRGGQGLRLLPGKDAAPSAAGDKGVSTPAGGDLKLDMKSPLGR